SAGVRPKISQFPPQIRRGSDTNMVNYGTAVVSDQRRDRRGRWGLIAHPSRPVGAGTSEFSAGHRGEPTMRVRLGAALAFIALGCVLAAAGFSQKAGAQARLRAPTAAETGETSKVLKINNWTVGLAGGLPEGAFIRFAAEIARNLNDSEEMRV